MSTHKNGMAEAVELALFYYRIARRDCINAAKDKSASNRTLREIHAGAVLDAKQDLELARKNYGKSTNR